MADKVIFNKNCKHKWIKRESRHPLTGELLASWDLCIKCGSEKNRKVY